MLDDGEVGWRVVAADAALVVAKDHVHRPVMALDAPVTTDRVALAFCVSGRRRDVEPRLLFGLSAGNFTHALDHDDALQTGPVMTLFEPINSATDV